MVSFSGKIKSGNERSKRPCRAHSLHLQGDDFVHYVFMVLYPLGKFIPRSRGPFPASKKFRGVFLKMEKVFLLVVK